MPSFADDLYDKFDAVNRHTEEGLLWCRDVAKFLKQLSQIEEDYAKALNKLCGNLIASPPLSPSRGDDVREEPPMLEKTKSDVGLKHKIIALLGLFSSGKTESSMGDEVCGTINAYFVI